MSAHLDSLALDRLRASEASPEERAHLDSCAHCQGELHQLHELAELFRRAEGQTERPPPAADDPVLEAARHTAARVKAAKVVALPKRKKVPWAPAALASAALVFLTLGVIDQVDLQQATHKSDEAAAPMAELEAAELEPAGQGALFDAVGGKDAARVPAPARSPAAPAEAQLESLRYVADPGEGFASRDGGARAFEMSNAAPRARKKAASIGKAKNESQQELDQSSEIASAGRRELAKGDVDGELQVGGALSREDASHRQDQQKEQRASRAAAPAVAAATPHPSAEVPQDALHLDADRAVSDGVEGKSLSAAPAPKAPERANVVNALGLETTHVDTGLLRSLPLEHVSIDIRSGGSVAFVQQRFAAPTARERLNAYRFPQLDLVESKVADVDDAPRHRAGEPRT